MTSPVLDQLYLLTAHLLTTQTPRKTYSTIVKDLLELLNGTDGSIFVGQNGKLVRKYSTLPHKEQVVPRPNGYSYSTYHDKKIYILNTQTFLAIHPETDLQNIFNIILIPLSYNNKSIGVVSIRSQQFYKEEDTAIELAVLYGSLASLKIRDIQIYQELKKAIQARDLFISMASHELKTPLTTMQLYADLIIQSIQNEKIPKVQWANTLKEQTKRLQRLINELLAAKTITAGKLQFSFNTVSIEDIIQKAITTSSAIYPNIQYVFNHPNVDKTTILTDDQKLLQAITNLLTNAAKFSEGSNKVDIFLKPEKEIVEITIRDYGRGIQTKDLPNIFKKYYTSRTNKRGSGMGLGLFITKSIIEGHKGKISVHSELNRGTAVTIALPRHSHISSSRV